MEIRINGLAVAERMSSMDEMVEGTFANYVYESQVILGRFGVLLIWGSGDAFIGDLSPDFVVDTRCFKHYDEWLQLIEDTKPIVTDAFESSIVSWDDYLRYFRSERDSRPFDAFSLAMRLLGDRENNGDLKNAMTTLTFVSDLLKSLRDYVLNG